VVALDHVHADRAHALEGRGVLDALGYDAQAEGVAEVHDAAQDGVGARSSMGEPSGTISLRAVLTAPSRQHYLQYQPPIVKIAAPRSM
jgi:hypothetical protein